MCFRQVSYFPGCDHKLPLGDEVEQCARARLTSQPCPTVESQSMEFSGKCFDCRSQEMAAQANKEEDRFDQELEAALQASENDTAQPRDDEWEDDLDKILRLSLQEHEEQQRALASRPKLFYDMHVRYECGHEENIGTTEIERDADQEGPPYLVQDDYYHQCPDCRGGPSAAQPHQFVLDMRAPSTQLPANGFGEEDDPIDLVPQGGGKGQRGAPAPPPLLYEPTAEDVAEARQREAPPEFEDNGISPQFRVPPRRQRPQGEDLHELHFQSHTPPHEDDARSERSYASDDEFGSPPDLPGYGTVDNLALANYVGEERERQEAKQRAKAERLREEGRRAKEEAERRTAKRRDTAPPYR
ncbi:hypothetical protein K432DRAFT_442537 [Lepidopterella palustris CBS 459.81]|uniref:Uncharacterized protein n=1 Tax=Lepidopterella palustris CBS 459.81 TaxID=1314670 RepID=A0A8E2EC11_9PEZI|nr:hypothetical protein K432DRAFT_442537 [Lepidopterella palustris CBS 459.81]